MTLQKIPWRLKYVCHLLILYKKHDILPSILQFWRKHRTSIKLILIKSLIIVFVARDDRETKIVTSTQAFLLKRQQHPLISINNILHHPLPHLDAWLGTYVALSHWPSKFIIIIHTWFAKTRQISKKLKRDFVLREKSIWATQRSTFLLKKLVYELA